MNEKSYRRKIELYIIMALIMLMCCLSLCGCKNGEDEESAWSEYLSENIDKLITLVSVISGVFGGVALSIYKVVKCIKELKESLSNVEEHKQSLDKITLLTTEQREVYLKALERVDEVKAVIEKTAEEIVTLKENIEASNEKETKALYLALTNNGELVKKGVAREIGLLLEGNDEKR